MVELAAGTVTSCVARTVSPSNSATRARRVSAAWLLTCARNVTLSPTRGRVGRKAMSREFSARSPERITPAGAMLEVLILKTPNPLYQFPATKDIPSELLMELDPAAASYSKLNTVAVETGFVWLP